VRLQRFLLPAVVDSPSPGTVVRYGGVDQLRKVFRFKTGDQVILFDGTGKDFICEIVGYEKDFAHVRVIEILDNTVAPPRTITLCAAIVKKDTFEWIVQKATEMGVSRIVPIRSVRSEKKDVNVERLNRIMIEAAEQSGRATLPVLSEPKSLEESFPSGVFHGAIAWEPASPHFNIKDIEALGNDVTVYIGPEGGWDPRELELFKEKGVPLFSMGPQILRAETAVVAGLSFVAFQ
jgi:16S rRNA (uracil1498-N3)-methyltransferase